MKKLKFSIIIFCSVFVMSLCALGIRVLYICGNIPEEIYVLEGESYKFNEYGILSPMFTLEKQVSEGGMLKDDGTVDTAKEKSSVSVLGIDVKNVNVTTVPKNSLVPVGSCVGVKIFAGGIVVADRVIIVSDDGKEYMPAKDAGIKNGDVITSVNGEITDSIADFEKAVHKSGGNPLSIVYKRFGKTRSTTIIPKKENTSGKYKVGLAVRDSMAGIGTLTYYCPQTKTFGALGHGIEAEEYVFPVQNGTVEPAKVLSLVKGRKGLPGELHGAFTGADSLGEVRINSKNGIFGIADPSKFDIKNAIPIASKSEVKKGDAYILSTIDGENIEKYDIEIEKIFPVSTGGKAIVIHITDKKLIEKTGGIIQGMSGSPIVQNGKLVGAVTHVFVNDPTRGYGIFIENMLAEAEKVQ